jgi:hypothetical protein
MAISLTVTSSTAKRSIRPRAESPESSKRKNSICHDRGNQAENECHPSRRDGGEQADPPHRAARSFVSDGRSASGSSACFSPDPAPAEAVPEAPKRKIRPKPRPKPQAKPAPAETAPAKAADTPPAEPAASPIPSAVPSPTGMNFAAPPVACDPGQAVRYQGDKNLELWVTRSGRRIRPPMVPSSVAGDAPRRRDSRSGP